MEPSKNILPPREHEESEENYEKRIWTLVEETIRKHDLLSSSIRSLGRELRIKNYVKLEDIRLLTKNKERCSEYAELVREGRLYLRNRGTSV